MKRFIRWLFDYPPPQDTRIDAVLKRLDDLERSFADYTALNKEELRQINERFETHTRRPGTRLSFAQLRQMAEAGSQVKP